MDITTGTTISSIASTLGVVIVAWLAYKTARLGHIVEKVAKQTDGLTTALVAKTAEASHAEGVLAGKAELKAENQLPR